MDKILSQPKENIIIGFRQVRKAANNNHLRCVVIAKDTDQSMIAQITALCTQKQIPYRFCETKAEIGKMLKIEVACSVCGIKKSVTQEIS